MKKFLGCMVVILSVVVLSGCEWGSSSGGSTWSDSYSWVNFAGVYRPPAGRSYLVQTPGISTNAPGSTAETTQSLGSGDGNQSSFTGTLSARPIAIGSVVVRAGAWSMADGDGDGNLSGGEGVGVINYSSGVITINWNIAPSAGINVIVTYRYSVPGSGSSPTGPTSGNGSEIYSMTLSQTGNILDAVDSNGVVYHGEISGMSQSGGDKTGNTSGSVVANFTMTADGGVKIVGVLNGTYIAPDNGDGDTSVNGGGTAQRLGKATDTEVDASSGAVTTGRLLNRQMQGTYIAGDGSSADIQGQAGNITVTVSN